MEQEVLVSNMSSISQPLPFLTVFGSEIEDIEAKSRN